MNDAMVEIAVYGSKLEAELAKQRLAASGIPAFVGSDTAGGMIPSLGMAEGHRLLVQAEQVDAAVALLEDSDAGDLEGADSGDPDLGGVAPETGD
jgi:hypothetical protein